MTIMPVAVIKDGITVGHVPREICKNVNYFLNHDENIPFLKKQGSIAIVTQDLE